MIFNIDRFKEYRMCNEEELSQDHDIQMRWTSRMNFLLGVPLPYEVVEAIFCSNDNFHIDCHFLNPTHPDACHDSWYLSNCFIFEDEKRSTKELINIPSIL